VWSESTWLTRDAPAPEPSACQQYQDDPAPLFRAEVALSRPARTVQSARAYVTGLGYYELEINGLRIGDQVSSVASDTGLDVHL
jgi:hypothetical protein